MSKFGMSPISTCTDQTAHVHTCSYTVQKHCSYSNIYSQSDIGSPLKGLEKAHYTQIAEDSFLGKEVISGGAAEMKQFMMRGKWQQDGGRGISVCERDDSSS